MPDEPNADRPEDYYDGDDPPPIAAEEPNFLPTTEKESQKPQKTVGYGKNAARPIGKSLVFPIAWLFSQKEEKLTAVATIAIAVFTVVLALTSYLQWREMHIGGEDTHKLAVAAGNQATWTQNLAAKMQTQSDRTKELADRMKEQAEQTKAIAGQAVIQADATNNLAIAASHSAKASETANVQSKDFFKLEFRPWVGLDGDVRNEMRPQPNGSNSRFADYTIKNFGSAPAFKVVFLVQPNFYEPMRLNDSDIEKAIGGMCIQSEQELRSGKRGQLLLPNGEAPSEWNVANQGTEGFLVLTGCIAYADIEGGIHHTGTCHIIGLFANAPAAKRWDACPVLVAD